jgi:hypothetical protein
MDITVYRDDTTGREAVYVAFDDGDAGIVMIKDANGSVPVDEVPPSAHRLYAVFEGP